MIACVAVPEAKHTIELDGRRLAWRSLGSGPALVLVNGYSATAADWDPTLLGALAASFELICPDNRGVGDSQLGDPGELSIDAMARDLIALLDALGLEQASFAGWSMGGFVAQTMATLAPARVRRMVLLATDPGGSAATLADPDVWGRLTDDSGSPREQATRLLSVLFPPEVAVAIDRMFGEVVAGARAALSPVALRAQERAIEAWHAREPSGPGPGTPPVLALCGGLDVVIPPANLKALAARWPGAKTEVFDGGGHAFMAQEPERLAAAITGFLAQDAPEA
ncbi:MAG TPA: alpha/beta hydrolase [Solirubrobacteraceae bacterium]|nr:alpha/beta hydrolase [Solirubrobacteraceae bacterium]